MRTLPFGIIRWQLRPLFGCLAVFATMALLTAPMVQPPASASETGGITTANFTANPTGSSMTQKPILDFDGDGKTDYAVVRDIAGKHIWYIQRSTLGFVGQTFGNIYDYLVPGDYDGDLKWDIAVWREGTFYILKSTTGALQVVQFGTSGDDPSITQDFDGDGFADPAVTRDNVDGTLTWYLLQSTLGFTAVTFGNHVTDLLIRGDFDGDGKADIAVYRGRNGDPWNTFFVLRSSDGEIQTKAFGFYNTDYILPADFDGDGKTDYAVWRGKQSGSTGTWYWQRSSDGGYRALDFGLGGHDLPVPGDYDGDGKTDQAVWRALTPAYFYINGSEAGFVAYTFGQFGDVTIGSQLQAD